ncbi:MAG TPA: hypothetical protein VK843_17560 [Planctomycetota bacterium]|nr:hypothetical protein [Planctomycetota bacterium]
MKRADFILGVLLLPCLELSRSNEERLVFEPSAGSVVSKQFTFDIEFSNTTVAIAGYEYGSVGYGAPIRLATSVSLDDAYTKVGDGRPLDFIRRFNKLSGKWFLDGVPEDILGFWRLSDCDVRFQWDPEERQYSRALERGTLLDLEFSKLVADIDFRGFLPPEPVHRGSKWTAYGRPAMDGLFGCTEMGLLGASTDRDEGLLRDIVLRPFRELGDEKLEIECVYLGNQDPDSNRADISMHVDQKFEIDVVRPVNDFCLAAPMELGLEFEAFELQFHVEGPGSLTWNFKEGHFEAFELALKVELKCEIRLSWGGDPLPIHLETRGTAKWNGSALRKQ